MLVSFQKTGFTKPISIEDRDGLDMVVRDSGFACKDVVELLGNPFVHLLYI